MPQRILYNRGYSRGEKENFMALSANDAVNISNGSTGLCAARDFVRDPEGAWNKSPPKSRGTAIPASELCPDGK